MSSETPIAFAERLAAASRQEQFLTVMSREAALTVDKRPIHI